MTNNHLIQKMGKGINYLKHYGPKDFLIRLKEKHQEDKVPYQEWFNAQRISQEQLEIERRQSAGWADRPLLCIVVPLYHTTEQFLSDMISSVQTQSYENWQLCLADGSTDDSLSKLVNPIIEQDHRVCYQKLSKNFGIAGNTNAALGMAARGDWVAFLDHDDFLEPNALFEAVACMHRYTEAGRDLDMIYTDEDKTNLEGTHFFSPHFKPDFNPDLLRCNHYITHFLLVKQELLQKAGPIAVEFDGAQDYDFVLRCSELAAGIGHIPKVLYHWRTHENSTSGNPFAKTEAVDAGKRAIQAHMERCGLAGTVKPLKHMGFFDVSYDRIRPGSVSVVLYESNIIVQSQKQALCSYNCERRIQELSDFTDQTGCSCEFLSEEQWHAKGAAGEYLVFLRSDGKLETKDWLQKLLGIAQRPQTGIVGGKSWNQRRVLTGGVWVLARENEEEMALLNVFANLPKDGSGYMHKAILTQDCSCLCGDCVMISNALWKKIAIPLLEQYSRQGNTPELWDVFQEKPQIWSEICVKIRETNKQIVYLPKVELQIPGRTPVKKILARWEGTENFPIAEDPYYHKNLSATQGNYTLRIS